MPPPFDASSPCLDDVFSSLLARRQAQGILRQLPSHPDARVSTPAPDPPTPAHRAGTGTPHRRRRRRRAPLVDFSSNDYLSLSRRPDVLREYLARLGRHVAAAAQDDDDADDDDADAFGLGSGGSRLLDGDSARAARLERALAAFHRAGAALLFGSGFEANAGLLACAPRPGDAVVLDELAHASAHAGVRLSRVAPARVRRFAHNAVWARGGDGGEGEDGEEDRRATLDGVLRRLTDGEAGRPAREGRAHVFVAVEAVYSMDGDVAPLLDVVRCVERRLPLGNGHVVVDEAHSNGLFGDRGRGLVCQLGLEGRVWARVNTFGKALGCSGAVVLCSSITRAYLVNYARTVIYTTAMGPPALLSIQVAYDFVTSGRADAPRRRLQGLIRHLGARLARVGASPPLPQQQQQQQRRPGIIRVSEGSPQSPIIPIFTSRARSLAEHCQRRGYMVRAIVAPTVPRGTDRVRVCLHAGNTVDECDGLCEAIEEWVAGQVVPPTGTMPPPPAPVAPVAPVEEEDVRGIKHRL